MSAVLRPAPSFERMTETDLPGVLEIERSIYPFPWTPGNFQDSLRAGYSASEELKKEIATHVKKHLAGHAAPREIEFRDKLPKTRSGKIMRRVLKAWDQGLPVGDISTLED